jgi:uncharacterized protein YukE
MAQKTDERYDHAALTEMSKAFQQAAETLQQTMNSSKEISKMMESGALEGDAGDQFREIIGTALIKKLTNLHAKMLELKKDVDDAMSTNKQAVSDAKGRFN